MTSHSIETIAIATANAMKKEGLDGFEDHPDKIITKAIKTYAIDDEDFQIRMTMVAEKMTEIIGKNILRDNANVLRMIEGFEKDGLELPKIKVSPASNDKI